MFECSGFDFDGAVKQGKLILIDALMGTDVHNGCSACWKGVTSMFGFVFLYDTPKEIIS